MLQPHEHVYTRADELNPWTGQHGRNVVMECKYLEKEDKKERGQKKVISGET